MRRTGVDGVDDHAEDGGRPALAGTVTLTDSDRALMAAMPHSSDDDAADTLWSRYSGADHQAFNADFPAYGLTGLQP